MTLHITVTPALISAFLLSLLLALYRTKVYSTVLQTCGVLYSTVKYCIVC